MSLPTSVTLCPTDHEDARDAFAGFIVSQLNYLDDLQKGRASVHVSKDKDIATCRERIRSATYIASVVFGLHSYLIDEIVEEELLDRAKKQEEADLKALVKSEIKRLTGE